MSLALPADCENQSNLQLRWVRRDMRAFELGVPFQCGPRPSFAVDNVRVTGDGGNPCAADATPPALTCPADISRLVDPNACTAVVSFTPTATDNCSAVTIVATPPSGSAFPIGTTPVSVTATDGSGNSSECSFSVTVSNPAPVAAITGPASGTVVAVNTALAFTGSFADNVGDTHTANWFFDGNPAADPVTIGRCMRGTRGPQQVQRSHRAGPSLI